MDCFTQLLEAYLSTKSNEFTDALALEGLKAIKYSLKRSYVDGGDIEARTGMSFAALTSGICLANAGLGAVHGFASSIGGMHQVPHGILCGTLMAVANEINLRQLRKTLTNNIAAKKYAMLGKMFLDESGKTKDYYADAFISYLHVLTIELRLPDLDNLGLKRSMFQTICEKTDVKNNPVKLEQDELLEILERRFH
jgi:alcohol dehydrogenase class IV